MTPRLTRAAQSWLGLVALALSLALLSGRPELVLLATPLVLYLVAGFQPAAPSLYRLAHEVSAERLFEGDRLTVTFTLSARTRIDSIELVEPLPPTLQLVSGFNRVASSLHAGQSASWSYEIRCLRRGQFALGIVHVRLRNRSGLWAADARHGNPTPLHVYPYVAPLRCLPLPRRPRTVVGNYIAPVAAAGVEPADIRPFAPGDEIRHVNWRASLRLRTLHVTTHHPERNADVVLMLDTLAEVGAPPRTTLDASVRAAAALARAYLARRDRVGMIDYGGALRWVKPGWGPTQLERLLDALVAAKPLFTYVRKDLAMVPPRGLPPGALVIALSPLIDVRFVDAVADLAARRFDVVVVAVSPIDATRASVPRSVLNDLACRLWALERRAQIDDLRRRGLAVVEWSGDEPIQLALVLLSHRRSRRSAVA